MQYKNVLVTGGAGFVGSHLCEALVKEGCKVTSLDNYSSGSKDNHVAGVEYLHCDTKDISQCDLNVDLIYHLGEYSRVEESFNDCDKVFESNTIGTLEVVKYANDHNCKLVYAGSSTKFGDNGTDSSPYAFTKSTNTQLVKNVGAWYGLEYAITYFYNVYGPREIASGSYATVIAKFNNFRKAGFILPVTSPGSQVRNFTHVSDIVSGLLLVGDYGIGDGYGIGADQAYSILQVAEMFDCDILMQPEKLGNRMSAQLITDKVKALGWKQNIYLEEYITNLIKT
jgi:UDP-glucose 4-epimerase